MSLNRRQHDHDHSSMGDMDMAGMNMSNGGYNNYTLQKDFWIFIGSVMAFSTFVNVLDKILLRQRLRSQSAKPKSFFWSLWATVTAIGRELFGATRSMFGLHFVLGPVLLVVAYSIAVIVLMYIGTETSNSLEWEDIAVRIGCINQAQLPLLFLLAGKQNVIGWFTGLGYERLNWLHRWISRIVWVGVTMHMGFFFRSWIRWNYIIVKLKTDDMTQTGFAAWIILTAIFLLSFAPVRRWNYELFIISHVILFSGVIGAVMIHVDTGAEYVWSCVALYLFDRTARFLLAIFCNVSFWRRKTWWANHATLTPLPGNVTRITIDKPVVSWSPGQHVFLSCHSIVPLQSHPFTIASLPSDEKLEFLIQAQKGGTKRFNRWAAKYERLPDVEPQQKMVGIEGPYGHLRPLQQFDSVVFIAGSTGATFTTPLMRDLVQRWKQGKSAAATRTIRFVWVIRSKDRLSWFESQLKQAKFDVDSLRRYGLEVELDITVYITCDEGFAANNASQCGSERSDEPEENTQADLISSVKNEVQVVEEKVDTIHQVTRKCCCRKTVNDDKEPRASCCCNLSSSKSSDLSLSSSSSSVHHKSRLNVLTGRPHLRKVIRKVLEDAEGESAVIACGPTGLQNDVRRSVVGLSDERAVHKGTGAQGIYLHVEGFGY